MLLPDQRLNKSRTPLPSCTPQVVKAMTEAEAHPGVSLVVAYAPCALQGPDGGMSKSQTVRWRQGGGRDGGEGRGCAPYGSQGCRTDRRSPSPSVTV